MRRELNQREWNPGGIVLKLNPILTFETLLQAKSQDYPWGEQHLPLKVEGGTVPPGTPSVLLRLARQLRPLLNFFPFYVPKNGFSRL